MIIEKFYNLQAFQLMSLNDTLTSISNRGPIVELRQERSQKSLYSENQIDESVQLVDKGKNMTKANIIVNKRIIDSSKLKQQIISKSTPQNSKIHKQKHNEYNKKSYGLSMMDSQGQTIEQSPTRQVKKSKKQIGSQNASYLRHEYKNYRKQGNVIMDELYPNHAYKQSPKQLLKFQEFTKPKVNQSIFDDIARDSPYTTQSNFNQLHSLDYKNPNSQKTQNRSLRSSQGGRWLRSQSYMHENQNKKSLHESLIRNYHKHESKYFSSLQRYMKVFMQFEEKLLKQPFGVSLTNNLQDIKMKMQLYMQKCIQLQNSPIDKPNSQWTQTQLTKFFTNYEPIFLSPQSITSSTQTLTLKKYKNCVYFGHMKNGKKEGEGIIYYFNGKLFEGNFINDQKTYGFEMEEEQDEIYLGQFDKGLRSGLGILKNNECLLWGLFSNGEFTNEQKEDLHQNGRSDNVSKLDATTSTLFNNRVKIDQSIKSSKKLGFKLSFNSLIVYCSQYLTIMKNSSNDLYIGSFNEQTNQKDGQGLQIFVNGDLYIGNYQNNAPEQYGEYYWASGAYYRGEFMSGMRHGNGKWHMLHGDCYEGEYMNDKKNGKGTYLWKNGSKYIGEFQNDYRHGYGEMRWNDGRFYKGEWVNGIEKNVQIKLDKGIKQSIKNPGATIAVVQDQKKIPDAKKPFLPNVSKRALRSSSNPNTKNSFHTIGCTLPVSKKITIESIKALYNPSNL